MNSPVDKWPDDFEAGRLAYLAGRVQSDCPYRHEPDKPRTYKSGQRQAWLAGWLEAAYFTDYWRRKRET